MSLPRTQPGADWLLILCISWRFPSNTWTGLMCVQMHLSLGQPQCKTMRCTPISLSLERHKRILVTFRDTASQLHFPGDDGMFQKSQSTFVTGELGDGLTQLPASLRPSYLGLKVKADLMSPWERGLGEASLTSLMKGGPVCVVNLKPSIDAPGPRCLHP